MSTPSTYSAKGGPDLVEDRASSPLFFDPDGGPSSLDALEGIDAVIHLAGEPIGDHRWDARVRSSIYSSRVYGTRSLIAALAALKSPPATVLVASASGIYGDRGSEELTEESTQGAGFLAKVVTDWEAESRTGEGFANRLVLLRTGVVVDASGGLLGRLLPLFRLGQKREDSKHDLLRDQAHFWPWTFLLVSTTPHDPVDLGPPRGPNL